MRSFAAALALGGALVFAPPAVRADEPVTGFVYTTDLLPEGKYEVEQWMTWRAHKAVGVYNVIEARSEFEYGVTDAFQLSGYINYEWAEAYHNNVIDGTTLPPETFAQLDVGPDENFHTTRFTGVALEGIYRILSPYTDPIGLAVLIEPTVGPSLRELETRVIVQKNYFDDRLILAFNLTVAQEVRRVPGDPSAPVGSDDFNKHWDKETDMNFGLAGSYRFAPNWSFGLELQHEREWAGLNPFDGDKATNAAFYFGPTIHYGGEHFFATLTVLDQLPWGKDDANNEPDFVVGGRNYADDFERFRVRAKVGWYF
jgi:hypothetical protein